MQASLAPRPQQHDRRARDVKPSVLLVDDHDLFRAALRQLLDAQGLQVVGDCRCGDRVGEMARRAGASIVVVDATTIDGASTTPVIDQLVDAAPDLGIVVFAHVESGADLYQLVRAGARAVVRKQEQVDQLVTAIRAVHAGGAWLEHDLLAHALELLRTGEHPVAPVVAMTDRELEVLRHVAAGLENHEIAQQLGISAKTAKNHVSSILTKLRVQNRVQAAVWAVRTGLV